MIMSTRSTKQCYPAFRLLRLVKVMAVMKKKQNKQNINEIFPVLFKRTFIIAALTGLTETNTTLLEGRLGLTKMK